MSSCAGSLPFWRQRHAAASARRHAGARHRAGAGPPGRHRAGARYDAGGNPTDLRLGDQLDAWLERVVWRDLALSATHGNAQDEIYCQANDSDGKITVPASLLGNLTTGDTVGVDLARFMMTTVTADNAVVNLSVWTEVAGSGLIQ